MGLNNAFALLSLLNHWIGPRKGEIYWHERPSVKRKLKWCEERKSITEKSCSGRVALGKRNRKVVGFFFTEVSSQESWSRQALFQWFRVFFVPELWNSREISHRACSCNSKTKLKEEVSFSIAHNLKILIFFPILTEVRFLDYERFLFILKLRKNNMEKNESWPEEFWVLNEILDNIKLFLENLIFVMSLLMTISFGKLF